MIGPQIDSISATLKEYPLCQQIIHFLLENRNAMDTVKGIAACWIDCDEVAVQSALDRLLICGAVTAHSLTSGTIYGLTRDQAILARLCASPGVRHRRRGSAARQQQPGELAPISAKL
jgi:hypothetical protein